MQEDHMWRKGMGSTCTVTPGVSNFIIHGCEDLAYDGVRWRRLRDFGGEG